MEMWKCHTTGPQLPIPDEESQIFWEGCRRQRLLVQQCNHCGTFRFPPSPLCRVCLGALTTWHKDPGKGEILTYCVYHAELAGPAWRAHLPYTVVVVQLWYSGVKMLSNLVCDDPRVVRIGLPVRINFEAVNTWIALPKFFPLWPAKIVP